MQEEYYLSIIAVSRNDAHGGNMLKRMRLFVNGLIHHANHHKMYVELILVEWNPPPDREPLSAVLPQPQPADYLHLKYIVVPPELHQQYKRHTEIPLFQMIGKNVGLQRAKGKFILCTNVDLLFSNTLFSILAQQNLREDTFYRANRCDVPDEIDEQWSIERQLDWCEHHVIRSIGRDCRFRHINLEQLGLNRKTWIKKWLFDKMSLVYQMGWPREKRDYFQLDTFACGDFTLMSKTAWMDIQGYLELDLYSIHIDSFALVAASAIGYQQHVFSPDACTYHIDHPSGWETMTPLEKIKFLENRPGLGYDILYDAGMYVLKHRCRFDLNPENWGFGDVEL